MLLPAAAVAAAQERRVRGCSLALLTPGWSLRELSLSDRLSLSVLSTTRLRGRGMGVEDPARRAGRLLGAREARKARFQAALRKDKAYHPGYVEPLDGAREAQGPRLRLLQGRGVRDGQHPEGAYQRGAPEDQAQQGRKVGRSAQ